MTCNNLKSRGKEQQDFIQLIILGLIQLQKVQTENNIDERTCCNLKQVQMFQNTIKKYRGEKNFKKKCIHYLDTLFFISFIFINAIYEEGHFT